MTDDLIPDDLAGMSVPAVPMAAYVSKLRFLAGKCREGLTAEQAATVLENAADQTARAMRAALLEPDQTANNPDPEENR